MRLFIVTVFTILSAGNFAQAGFNDFVDKISLLDQKIVSVGTAATEENGEQTTLVFSRLNLDGTLDTSFGRSGIMTYDMSQGVKDFLEFSYVNSTIDQKGRFLVVGTIEQTTDTFSVFLTRFSASGEIDKSFGSDGFVSIKGVAPAQVISRPDGRLIVVDGNQDYDFPRLIALNEDGSIYKAFGEEGVLDLAPWRIEYVKLALSPDGKVLVGGSLIDRQKMAYFCVLRLTESGQLDVTFGKDGVAQASFGAQEDPGLFGDSILVHRNGKITLSGTIGVFSYAGIARFNADGKPDSVFGVDGAMILARSPFQNLSETGEDDRIILSGCYKNRIFMDRLKPDGTLDSKFDHEEAGLLEFGDKIPRRTQDWLSGIVVDSTGNTYMGAMAGPSKGVFDHSFAALDPFGRPLSSFGKDGKSYLDLSLAMNQ